MYKSRDLDQTTLTPRVESCIKRTIWTEKIYNLLAFGLQATTIWSVYADKSIGPATDCTGATWLNNKSCTIEQHGVHVQTTVCSMCWRNNKQLLGDRSTIKMKNACQTCFFVRNRVFGQYEHTTYTLRLWTITCDCRIMAVRFIRQSLGLPQLFPDIRDTLGHSAHRRLQCDTSAMKAPGNDRNCS
jgi:hypothetical protein